jgi:hypothetical protein
MTINIYYFTSFFNSPQNKYLQIKNWSPETLSNLFKISQQVSKNAHIFPHYLADFEAHILSLRIFPVSY